MVSKGNLALIGVGTLVIVGILLYYAMKDTSPSGDDPSTTKDCVFSNWSDWTLCDKDCGGGLRRRTRTLVSGNPVECQPLSQVETCNSVACPLETCQVSEWSEWSKCSSECGPGSQSRNRDILNNFKPEDCPDLHQTRECKEKDCPEGCHVGDWSEWSECSRPCGGGVQRRTREVIDPGNTGMPCPSTEDVKACNTFSCPVDCQVSEWGDWSECDKMCGGGKHHRSRNITVQPAGGGKECPVLHEEGDCNTQECYRDCKVGDWGSWSECSKTCGGGTTTRTREVLETQIGRGIACPETSQTAPCNSEACPQDCQVSDWSAWSACSQECGGGTQSRTRSIIRPQIGTGAVCPPLIESRVCNSVECPSDCKVGDWSSWSQCNAPCGGGVRERTRQIVSSATDGGVGCPSTIEHEQCNIQECPIDCRVSEWSNWSECSQACGGGTQSRTRTVTQYPNSTGQSCPTLTETRECNKDECLPDNCVLSEWSEWSPCSGCGEQLQKRTRAILKPGKACSFLEETRPCLNPGCPIDCKVSQWSDWSECDAVCGGGLTHRDRFIVQSDRNGGQSCPPLREETQCNTQACPIDCVIGDWSDWSACNKPCGGGVQIRNRSVIVQPDKGGQACPSTQEVKDCNTQTCPQDCEVGDWSGWSGCDKPCGGGKQSRTRTVITSSHDGGKDCPELIEYHDCNTQECPIDCKVGEWGPLSECSKPCGGGIKTQTRQILEEAKFGGIGCPAVSRSEECNTQPCDVDCQVGEWSPWAECDKVCGGGKQKRVRTITAFPVANGKECPPLEEDRDCNTQTCPINCEVSPWSPWSDCTRPCGGGLRKRARLIVRQPQYGGFECPALEETGDCNTQECITKVIGKVVPRDVPLYIGFKLRYGDWFKNQPLTTEEDYNKWARENNQPGYAWDQNNYIILRTNSQGFTLDLQADSMYTYPQPGAYNTIIWGSNGLLYFNLPGGRQYFAKTLNRVTSNINEAARVNIEYVATDDPSRTMYNRYAITDIDNPDYQIGRDSEGRLTVMAKFIKDLPYVTVAKPEVVF